MKQDPGVNPTSRRVISTLSSRPEAHIWHFNKVFPRVPSSAPHVICSFTKFGPQSSLRLRLEITRAEPVFQSDKYCWMSGSQGFFPSSLILNSSVLFSRMDELMSCEGLTWHEIEKLFFYDWGGTNMSTDMCLGKYLCPMSWIFPCGIGYK